MDQTVTVGTLKVGERFALIDRTFHITGTVKAQSQGYTSVRLDGGERTVTIGERAFQAHGTSTTEWSKETRVYRMKEDGEEEMDSVPIDSSALNGMGEPIPTPRPVPTPASFAINKNKEKTDVSKPKPKIKEDAKAQERIRLAEIRNKEKAHKAKAVAGPDGQKGPKPLNKCRCGCGGDTKSQFSPGHDARFYGWAKKVVAGKLSPEEIPTAAGRAELSTKAKAAKVLESHGA